MTEIGYDLDFSDPLFLFDNSSTFLPGADLPIKFQEIMKWDSDTSTSDAPLSSIPPAVTVACPENSSTFLSGVDLGPKKFQKVMKCESDTSTSDGESQAPPSSIPPAVPVASPPEPLKNTKRRRRRSKTKASPISALGKCYQDLWMLIPEKERGAPMKGANRPSRLTQLNIIYEYIQYLQAEVQTLESNAGD